VKNCDLGLENAALGLRPRAAFSRPRSQFFTIRTSQPVNNIYICGDLRNRHNLQLCICLLSCNLECSHTLNLKMIPLHRLKTSERLFIHKNLLLTLGLGNLLYVLDKNLFASRPDHVVCTKLWKSCFKQIASSTRDPLSIKLQLEETKRKRRGSCYWIHDWTNGFWLSHHLKLFVLFFRLCVRLWQSFNTSFKLHCLRGCLWKE